MTFLIQQTLIYAVPLMIVALAGVFAERSGIINLALEGIMVFGAFIGVWFVRILQTSDAILSLKQSGNWAALQGVELLTMLRRAVLAASELCVHQPACRPDHRRHGAEPDGPRTRAVLHPHHRQPEYAADAHGRRGELVHDQKVYARHRQEHRPRLFRRDVRQQGLPCDLRLHPAFHHPVDPAL